MGILNRFFGKKDKKAATAQPAPTSGSTGRALEEFARRASQSAASITIQKSEVRQLVDALSDALVKAYPHLGSIEAYSQATGGLSLRCPDCGQLSEQVVSVLCLAGTEVMQRAVFGGPNVAALAQGRCPGCGGHIVTAAFNPQKVQAQVAAAKAESAAVAGMPKLVSACTPVPFLGGLTLSPHENLVCCVAPGGAVVAYESGTTQQRWSLAVAAANECLCAFVGPERLLVLSQKQKDQMLWQLLNTVDGAVVAETLGPRVFGCAADVRTGVFFGHSVWELHIVQTAGDKLEFSSCKPHRQLDYGPWIGPNGKCYVLSTGRVHYLEGNEMPYLMPGEHCICYEPPTRVYCGGGHYDRSGPSALHIGDLNTGETSEIPWGREPIDQIALAGNGRLLLANIIIPTLGRSYPDAVVTLLSVASQKKEWSLTIGDLAPMRSPILASVPEEGWALIQSGTLLKVIALEDGRALRTLPKQRSEYITAVWLASKKLLYIARNPDRTPDRAEPGVLECYSM